LVFSNERRLLIGVIEVASVHPTIIDLSTFEVEMRVHSLAERMSCASVTASNCVHDLCVFTLLLGLLWDLLRA